MYIRKLHPFQIVSPDHNQWKYNQIYITGDWVQKQFVCAIGCILQGSEWMFEGGGRVHSMPHIVI